MAFDRALDELLNSAQATRALVQLYDRTIRRLIVELAHGVTQAQAFRIEATLGRLRKILDSVDPKKSKELTAWINANVRKAYVLGDDAATRSLREDLKNAPASIARTAKVDAQFTVINEIAVQGLAAAMASTLGKARESIEKVLGTVLRQTQTSLARADAIRNVTAEGFLRGSTRQQVADDIASILLGKHVPVEVKDRLRATGFDASMFNTFEAVARGRMITAGKRTFSVRQYADLVANTQMREAHKVATITRLRQNRISHVKVSKHPQRVPDVCTPFAGRVFYIGEGTDPAGFPPLRATPNGGPPWHPFCRHSIAAYVVALRTPVELQQARLAGQEIFPLLGKDSSAITREVKSLPAAAFKRIAGQGETRTGT